MNNTRRIAKRRLFYPIIYLLSAIPLFMGNTYFVAVYLNILLVIASIDSICLLIAYKKEAFIKVSTPFFYGSLYLIVIVFGSAMSAQAIVLGYIISVAILSTAIIDITKKRSNNE